MISFPSIRFECVQYASQRVMRAMRGRPARHLKIPIIKGPLGCLVSVKKGLKYTLLNSYYKSKCFARPQKACMLFTLAIFTGSSLKTFAPLKK